LGSFTTKDVLLGNGNEGYNSKGSTQNEALDLHLARGQCAVMDAQNAGFRGAFIGADEGESIGKVILPCLSNHVLREGEDEGRSWYNMQIWAALPIEI
jgi:hypothetical protein